MVSRAWERARLRGAFRSVITKGMIRLLHREHTTDYRATDASNCYLREPYVIKQPPSPHGTRPVHRRLLTAPQPPPPHSPMPFMSLMTDFINVSDEFMRTNALHKARERRDVL